MNGGAFLARDLYEIPATQEDLAKLRAMISDPAFRRAAAKVPKATKMIPLRSGILTIASELDGRRQDLLFDEAEGRAQKPEYIKRFIAFAEEVERRKLSKLKGGTAECPAP